MMCEVGAILARVISRMITGNIAMPRITGNMNRPSGPTIFTGSWLARSSARSSLRSRISSLKARKASPRHAELIDWRSMAARERASFIERRQFA